MAAYVELTWGKCTVTYTANKKTFTEEPKLDSTKLSVSEGSSVEAKIEGGDVIAVRRDRDSYTLEWQVYIHPDNIANYADRVDAPEVQATELKVTPENKNALAITVPLASIHSSYSFDTQGGIMLVNKATFLKSGTNKLFTIAKQAAA